MGDKVEALIQYEESQMVVLHIFCVLVCFLKQLQNFALGDIFFVLVCSAVNLLFCQSTLKEKLALKKNFF